MRLAVLIVALGFHGCVTYEYEHEFWIRVDGSGTVNVTGLPYLWGAFKGVGGVRGAEDVTTSLDSVRGLLARSGLRVRRVMLTRRRGQSYIFAAADFADVNALSRTPAFPDLRIAMKREGERLRLEGQWARPSSAASFEARDQEGLIAVRFHLPSRVYEHNNAFAGVERGNIVAWRETVRDGLSGARIEFGVLMDERSILKSTIGLFAAAIVLGVAILALAFYVALRKGRSSA